MIPSSLRRNHVTETLRSGGTVLGTWIMMSRNPGIVRIAAAAGFDFVFIDTEHSDFSPETVGDLCEIARACDIVPIVRSYDTSAHMANRLQDMGAMGLMYHDVTSGEAVAGMHRAMHYPPMGTRGTNALGPTLDYQTGDGAALQAAADQDAMLIAQVESREGVERIAEIVAGGFVDLVEVGRNDLATDLGLPMQPRHPDVMAAVDVVIEACENAGVAVGLNPTTMDDAQDLIARGVRSIAFSNDRRIILNAYLDAKNQLFGEAAAAKGASR